MNDQLLQPLLSVMQLMKDGSIAPKTNFARFESCMRDISLKSIKDFGERCQEDKDYATVHGQYP